MNQPGNKDRQGRELPIGEATEWAIETSGTNGGTELRSCVTVEVAVLHGLPSLIVRTVYVDVKQHRNRTSLSELRSCVKVRGGCPGLPVPNSPHGLCGFEAALNLNRGLQSWTASLPARWFPPQRITWLAVTRRPRFSPALPDTSRQSPRLLSLFPAGTHTTSSASRRPWQWNL